MNYLYDIIMDIVLEMIIVFIAGFIQGLTSFGFALVSVPFLVKIISLKETVPIVVVLSLFTNTLIIINCYKNTKLKTIWLLILFSILFAPIGVYSLKYINSDYLKLFIGTIIILFSILLLLKKSFPIKNINIGYAISGALSGFLNGSLSLSGPPVALFLSNQNIKKEGFRANITFYSIILNIITIGTYFINGMLNKIILENILYLVPTVLLGVFIGIKCSKRLDEKIFKSITLVLLIISGTWTIINAIQNMIQ